MKVEELKLWFKKMEEQQKMFNDTYAIIPSSVKPFGKDSGHISMPKKYLGHKVQVLVSKEKVEDNKDS